MSIRNKKVFVMGGFFIVGISILAFVCNNLSYSYTLDEVNLKYDNKSNSNLAIFKEKEDESGYEQVDKIPTDGYVFNNKKSGCSDILGNEIDGSIEYISATNTVKVKTKTTSYCYLYFDEIKDDVTITVSTDGVSNTVPTSGIYKTTTSCTNGNIAYNNLYQRLEMGGFSNGTNCTLDYTKDTTSYTLLSNVVQSNATTNANGYRYSGKTPNNYVWFNNELWRIIGLIPACTSASSGTCSGTTNLVKIIRNNSIGGLAYDAKSSGYTGLWGSNTLYTLLNSYYYGKQNGTDTDYCYGYQATAKAKCDYTANGVSDSSTDYYGKMVESVYWNIGVSDFEATPSTIYVTESAKVTANQAHIGLMSASDYGYAAVVSGYGTNLSSYNTAAITSTNWLCGQGGEWTNIQSSSNLNFAYDISDVCRASYIYKCSNSNGQYICRANGYGIIPSSGYAVRPVLYLNAGVYKISGSGTMTDPYIIKM